jgi:hypothetical protein
MAIVIVDLPTQNEVIFQFAFCMPIGYVAYIFPKFSNTWSILIFFLKKSIYFPYISLQDGAPSYKLVYKPWNNHH